MSIPLKKDERVVLEASASYLGTEGNLLLTDRRLIFYCTITEYLKPTEYEAIFDVPLDALTSASSRGYGLSTLVVETDTARVTGNRKHEFFLIDAHRWTEVLNHYLARQKRPARPGPPGARPGLMPPAQLQPGQSRFGKLCFNCMKVIPEKELICPYCGKYA